MKRVKSVLKKLLYPGWGIVCPAVILSAISLYLMFYVLGESSPFAYVSYVLSAYGLTIFVAAIVSVIPTVKRFLHSIPFVHHYLVNKHFAVWCALALSLVINFGFAILKLVYAALYSSFWDGALAVYYILLCAVRVYLLRSFSIVRKEQSYREELCRYRSTGVFLFFLDGALAVISTLIVLKGNGYYYPGTLIYAMAFHAFYCLTLGIINAAKYRKFNSPILSAAKAINLTTGFVSIFNLETAMLTRFNERGAIYRLTMTACTAFAVCAIVLGIAIHMVIRAQKAIKTEQGGT